jgi:CheY-like chemotaxis protein
MGKNCFVISPIGTDGTPERKRADQMLKHIFKGALEPLGYEVVRADGISVPGSINIQVIQRILESDLVVADLTDQNPNVFYELAIRHTTGKPVIHVVDAAQKLPFDVADLRAIPVMLDLDGADSAKASIAAQTKQIEAGQWGATAFQLATSLKTDSSANSDKDEGLRQLVQSVTELRTQLYELSENSKKQLSVVASLSIASAKTAKRQARILWVDDRPSNNTYEREAFEALGITITLALSTAEALQYLEQQEFSAIISDMGRKEGPREGYVLLDEIRRRRIQTPFFIYAGSNAPEHKSETEKHGGQGCTNNPQDLFEMVTRALLNTSGSHPRPT